jgi:ring-1,2-phenylacetyl-CoA epoxidase subunit PaaC
MATADTDLGDPEDLSEREQQAVEAQLFRIADDEYVQAERYTFWQVRAPTLESDLAVANNSQDELGHARLWYEAIQQFGYTEESLLFESNPEDFQHSTLVELPFEKGDWADAVVRAYLYDVAEDIRLSALEDSSYEIIRDRTSTIQGEEDYHVEHAQSWIERMVLDDDAVGRVQAALNRLYPYALTLFEPVGDVESDIEAFGIRTMSLDEMHTAWENRVEEFLTGLGLDVPTDAEVAEHIGRDNNHTDDWATLFEEMTSSYRNLDRDEATVIMDKDNE